VYDIGYVGFLLECDNFFNSGKRIERVNLVSDIAADLLVVKYCFLLTAFY